MALRKALQYIVILLVIWNSLKYEGCFEELMSAKESSIHSRQKRETSLNSTEYELQVVVSISDLEHFQMILNTLRFPLLINTTAEITSIDITTVCSSNITANKAGFQCTCEEGFAWSYNKCINYGACDAIIGATCGCINGLPADGQYCQLNTSQAEPVDFDIDFNLIFPVSSVPPNFIDVFRDYLANLSFPQTITEFLIIEELNFTTWCNPNATGGLQCECEDRFGWSCDKCKKYGACNNVTSQTCGCIKGFPPGGEFCEPITSISPCSPQPLEPVDFEIVLELHIPVSSVPPNFSDVLRDIVRNFSFPQTITKSLTLQNLTFTTWCYPNSTGGLQCQCEQQFAWSCDTCNKYGSCSEVTSPTCGCIKGLPPGGELCQPITSFTPCPPPSTTPMPNSTTPMPTSTSLMPTSATPMPTSATPMPNSTTPMPNSTSPMPTSASPVPTSTSPVPTSTSPVPNSATPVPNSTTPMPNSTTPMPNSTSPMPTSTSPVPTSATSVPTSTSPMPTSTTPVPTTAVYNLTINVDFSESYNDPNSPFFTNISKVINDTSSKNNVTSQLIKFRSGSTIAEYNVTAPSLQVEVIHAVNSDIFDQLAKVYTMISDDPNFLKFEIVGQGFFGDGVKVTCGPPPVDLFGTDWNEEWSRDGNLIVEDGVHSISNNQTNSILTVSTFIGADSGAYECRLKRKKDNSFYRQRSNGTFTLNDKPVIRVAPIQEFILCPGETQTLRCSVNNNYIVNFKDTNITGQTNISYAYKSDTACTNRTFICQSTRYPQFSATITLTILKEMNSTCNDTTFGETPNSFTAIAPCKENEEGQQTAVCNKTQYIDQQDTCILRPIKDLLDQSQFLTATTLPGFLEQLTNVTVTFSDQVAQSPNNIKAVVKILSNVANISSSLDISISNSSMENVLITAGILTSNKTSWNFLNTDDTINIYNNSKAQSVSSSFLQSIETVTSRLVNGTFNIDTPSILLNKTTFTDTFDAVFNSSVAIEIEAGGENKTITTIIFDSMDNVLPARDQANSSLNSINGRVALVQSSGHINNISLTFDILNSALGNPECVFWNFSLFDGLGGWDNEGCEVLLNVNETGTVTCSCNHLTSFSILMSPNSPEELYLDIITYIGVGLSMGSLVICLIIEALIWRKIRKNETSYLRHVSIVNIAVSLLIADIWFIIGAAISNAKVKTPPACTAATFFIHFFYLALFFWMLASALLLLYRTTNVFGGGLSKASMLAIGFILGYGAPLIIATVTIAATAPDNGYIRENTICWLNWDKTKALLAFVIPALSIVVINLSILVVVVYKIVRRRIGANAAQADERHVLVVIAKSLAVLTPFFGITWGLGAGILANPTNRGINIAFAFFNSLQGFFILVFGTLLDKKVRSEMAAWSQTSRSSRSGSRSTSAGNSSSAFVFLRNWRRGRDGYNVSSNASSDSASNT